MAYTQLIELLEQSARSENGITHILGESKDKHISYKELYTRALSLLGYFQEVRRMEVGQEIILLVNHNERFLDAFWACVLGGLVPVPLATGISDSHHEKIVKVFQKLKHPLIYSSRDEMARFNDYLDKSENHELKQRTTNSSIVVEDIIGGFGEGTPVERKADDLAFIQFSSGSTGVPKGVMLSHQNLLCNIAAITKASHFTPDDRTMGWMPLTHDLGLIGFHLVPLASSAHQLLMSTELFVRRPMLWMQKCAQHNITITGSPNFGYKHFLKYFSAEALQGNSLHRMRLILNGAEPISAPLCRSFMSQLASYGLPENSMFPVYGLAEASLAVTFPIPGSSLATVHVDRNNLGLGSTINFTESDSALELVKVGQPVDNCELSIVDAQSQAVPESTIGKLKIRGGNVTRGYYNDPETTEKTIQNEWLDTGDLGFIHEGSLIIAGRSKDVIFLNGQNLYPHDIESLLDQTDTMEIGKVAVTGVIDSQKMTEEPAVFVSFKGKPEEFIPLYKTIRGHLSAYMGLEVDKILPVTSIPKTTSGKIQRFLLADQYHRGDYVEIEQTIYQMLQGQDNESSGTLDQIEITLLDICKEFITEQISTTDNLFELGTSSLVLTQIHDRIDTLWPNQLELTDYFDYPTIAELAQYLKEKQIQSV